MDDWKLIHYFQDMGEAISLFKAILLAASLFKIELKFLSDPKCVSCQLGTSLLRLFGGSACRKPTEALNCFVLFCFFVYVASLCFIQFINTHSQWRVNLSVCPAAQLNLVHKFTIEN